MSNLRNRVGQLALVVPFEGAEQDIQVHGGKIVKCLSYGVTGLGGEAWKTDPVLYDGYGNSICWDDLDLKPLGDSVNPERVVIGEITDPDALEWVKRLRQVSA